VFTWTLRWHGARQQNVSPKLRAEKDIGKYKRQRNSQKVQLMPKDYLASRNKILWDNCKFANSQEITKLAPNCHSSYILTKVLKISGKVHQKL